MTSFTSPSGTIVGEDEACINGIVRDGYRVNFSINMMDHAHGWPMRDAASESPKSIDEALRRTVEEQAKAAGQKPSEWLAGRTAMQLEKLASEVAVRFIQAAGGAGVASAFAMDAAASGLGGSAQAVHDAVLGKVRSTPMHDALAHARTAITLAKIDADPSRAWRSDPNLKAAEAVRNAARDARY